jgi:adenine-specific DNA-methyltransferase
VIKYLGSKRCLVQTIASLAAGYRYFTNYHVWETLIRWDAPDHYGVACKRADSRSAATRSDFNSKQTMPTALAGLVAAVDATVVVVSYNDESWLGREELAGMCAARGHVEVLEFDSKRYVGAQIGIHGPAVQKVGQVSHLRNVERLAVCGPRTAVLDAIEGWRLGGLQAPQRAGRPPSSRGLRATEADRLWSR